MAGPFAESGPYLTMDKNIKMAAQIIRKTLAYALIAFQFVTPIQASADLNSALKSLDSGLRAVNAALGSGNPDAQGDPSPDIRVSTLGTPSHGNAIAAIEFGQTDVFDPTNMESTKRLTDRIMKARKAVAGKQALSYQDLYTYIGASRPFFLYLDGYNRIKNGGGITVMPGQEISTVAASLDIGGGSWQPASGYKLQMVPTAKLIDPKIKPFYSQAIRYAAGHQESRADVEKVLNTLRMASDFAGTSDKPPVIDRDVAPILDRIMPGYTQSLNDAITQLHQERKTSGWKRDQSEVDLEVKRSRWREIPELAPGVTAKANVSKESTWNNGKLQVNVANRSSQPFMFSPSDYAGRPVDCRSDTGLSGISNIFNSNGEPIFTEEGKKFAEKIVADFKDTLVGKTLPDGVKSFMGYMSGNPVLQDLVKSTPMVGTGIATWELMNGRDFFTGQPLSPANKLLAWASLVPGEGALSRVLGGAAIGTIRAARGMNEVVEVANAAESNTAQAVASKFDETLLSGKGADKAVYKALDDFAGDVRTPVEVAKAIKDQLTHTSSS